MRYLCAIFIPPLGIMLCGRWVQAILNLVVWLVAIVVGIFLIPVFGVGLFVILIGWIISIGWALAVCKVSSIDKRVDRIVNAVEAQRSSTGGTN